MNIYENKEILKVFVDNLYGMMLFGYRMFLDILKLWVFMVWRYNKNKEING